MNLSRSFLYSLLFCSSKESHLELKKYTFVISENQGNQEYNYLDLIAVPDVKKHFFWRHLRVELEGRAPIILKGFANNGKFRKTLERFKERVDYTRLHCTSDLSGIVDCCNEFHELKTSYIRQADLKIWQEKFSLPLPHRYNFTMIEKEQLTEEDRNIVELYVDLDENSMQVCEEYNLDFIQRSKEKYKQYFNTVETHPLTEKQREAVIVMNKITLFLQEPVAVKHRLLLARWASY